VRGWRVVSHAPAVHLSDRAPPALRADPEHHT
jgi:hypothetical protein